MKKTLLALAVALSATMAFAVPQESAQDEKHKQSKVEKRERKALTPEQFAEKKAKHLNKLENRKKVLEGEIVCTQSAQSMEDMKQCFKSAMDARKELGLFHMGKMRGKPKMGERKAHKMHKSHKIHRIGEDKKVEGVKVIETPVPQQEAK